MEATAQSASQLSYITNDHGMTLNECPVAMTKEEQPRGTNYKPREKGNGTPWFPQGIPLMMTTGH